MSKREPLRGSPTEENGQHQPGTCLPRCPTCIATFGTELSTGDILGGITERRDRRTPTASFVEKLASATSIFDPSSIVDPSVDDLAEYKAALVRMLREKAEHWQRSAATQTDSGEIATCLAYVGAYCDAANLIEFGEVAW